MPYYNELKIISLLLLHPHCSPLSDFKYYLYILRKCNKYNITWLFSFKYVHLLPLLSVEAINYLYNCHFPLPQQHLQACYTYILMVHTCSGLNVWPSKLICWNSNVQCGSTRNGDFRVCFGHENGALMMRWGSLRKRPPESSFASMTKRQPSRKSTVTESAKALILSFSASRNSELWEIMCAFISHLA